ncbi:ABC transporter substrate-binding protein [Streptomyces badius]
MRVVSLVPSLTEAVARTAPGPPVGVTDWRTHPARLAAARIGGTVPRRGRHRRPRPRPRDRQRGGEPGPRPRALRAAGLDVLVTEVRTLDQAFTELHHVLVDGCGLARPRWLDTAEAAWTALPAPSASPRPAVVPIWRRPWMVLGHDTFAGDLLARLGIRNVYADHPERYPRVPVDELILRAERSCCPTQPYRFTADDGPEAFPILPAALVDGRLLTWYGPSLTEAARVLPSALR